MLIILAKSKVAPISPISDVSSDEEVTIIHDTNDIDSDDEIDSLMNEGIEQTNLDDDDDDDDDTTVISTTNN